MTTLNEQISAALREGYDINDIAQHLAGSENPEHQAWGQRWIGNAQQPAYQPGAAIAPEPAPEPQKQGSTPLMDFVTEHPVAAGGAAVAGLAALKAPGLYVASQKMKLEKRRADIEERKLQAYEQQVARQGMAGQPMADEFGMPVQQQLSPLEQAKLETERVRAEQIKQKIALAEAKAAREETAAKAKAEAAAAQQAAKQRQNVSPSGAKPSELGMVASSETAKIEKAVDAEVRAQNAKAAVPQVAAKSAVPPPAAGPTIALTPSPEVVAEVSAEAPKAVKPAQKAAAPVGEVFKEGLGPGDNWLFNTYGAEGRRAILQAFNEGKPANTYKEAVALSKKVQEVTAGPQIPRDVAKSRGIAPTETNFGKLGKAGKVAGVAGLLMTAADAANAAQQKDYGKVVDVLSDIFVPPFAQSREAGMPRSQEEAILAQKYAEAQKLGSPYRSVPPKR